MTVAAKIANFVMAAALIALGYLALREGHPVAGGWILGFGLFVVLISA